MDHFHQIASRVLRTRFRCPGSATSPSSFDSRIRAQHPGHYNHRLEIHNRDPTRPWDSFGGAFLVYLVCCGGNSVGLGGLFPPLVCRLQEVDTQLDKDTSPQIDTESLQPLQSKVRLFEAYQPVSTRFIVDLVSGICSRIGRVRSRLSSCRSSSSNNSMKVVSFMRWQGFEPSPRRLEYCWERRSGRTDGMGCVQSLPSGGSGASRCPDGEPIPSEKTGTKKLPVFCAGRGALGRSSPHAVRGGLPGLW